MQVQVDTRDNKTVYSGSQFGSYSRDHSDSNGNGSVSVRPVHELGQKPLRFNWQTPILLSRWNQDIFYIGANKLYRSFNRGENLQPVSEDLSNGKTPGNVPYGTITTISESPLQYGLLYTGTDDGNIQVTTDAGTTWKKISGSLPTGLWVSRVVASRHKKARVYASLNGYRYDHFDAYVYMSEDYGTSWKNIGTGLPKEPVNVVYEDFKKDSIIYIGTDGGLYVSSNNGNSYDAWTNGLPKSIAIHDITIQPRENEILLGTHGRSIYVAKLEPEKK
jgi:ligand-binding sensor domain-containing protein